MTRWLLAVLLMLAAAAPAGTNSASAFTGTAFDPHPAFTRVIFCKKS